MISEPFRLQGFLMTITQLLHQAPRHTVSGCAWPCVDHRGIEAKVRPCTHTHTHPLPVVLHRGDVWWGPLWDLDFRLAAWRPQLPESCWGRLPVRVAYEIKDVNVNEINLNFSLACYHHYHHDPKYFCYGQYPCTTIYSTMCMCHVVSLKTTLHVCPMSFSTLFIISTRAANNNYLFCCPKPKVHLQMPCYVLTNIP